MGKRFSLRAHKLSDFMDKDVADVFRNELLQNTDPKFSVMRKLVLVALFTHGYNVSRAAQSLGISRNAMTSWMKKYLKSLYY